LVSASLTFGFLASNHARGIRPHDLAAEVEARGFDSVWYPEHSHIPLERKSPYPGGGELPEGAWELLDPVASLATAAVCTDRVRVCTGICLPLQHDLLALGKAVATVDLLSNGRVTMGIGAGWNADELANQRPDLAFGDRYVALAERVRALRTVWYEPEGGFEGRWDRFTPSRISPRPVQSPLPIAMGATGPLGMRHAAAWADVWCPVDVALIRPKRSVVDAIEEFHGLVHEEGRDPATVPIELFVWKFPDPDRITSYAERGITSFILSPPNRGVLSRDETLRDLDRLAVFLSEHGFLSDHL
jgi:probable F420-dependent oxidoreductase